MLRPRSAAARSPSPRQATADPRLQQTFKHSRQVWLSSVESLGPGAPKVLQVPSTSGQMGLILYSVISLLPLLVGLLLGPLDVKCLSLVGPNVLLWTLVQQSAAGLEFSQEQVSASPRCIVACAHLLALTLRLCLIAPFMGLLCWECHMQHGYT